MKKKGICAIVLVVLVLLVVLVPAVSGAADDETKGTPVELKLAQITIIVDQTVFDHSDGFRVSDNTSKLHTTSPYTAVVGDGKQVQIGAENLDYGWKLDTDLGTVSPDNMVTIKSVTGFMTVHISAKYTGTYTVSFDADGGTPKPDDQQVASGGRVTKPANPAKTGYTFAGWFNGDTAWDFTTDIVTSNLDLTARWTAITYKVHFDAGSGEGEQMADEEFVYDVGKPLTYNTYTKKGYTFKHWKDTNGNTYENGKWVENLTATDKDVVTLTAEWKPVTYAVTFDANGGSGDQMPDQPFTYDKAQKLTKNTYLAPEWKQFAGWATNASGSVVYTDELSVKNLTDIDKAKVPLYAVWSDKPKEYWKVSFDANGGSGSMAEISVEKGSSITVPANEFTVPEGKEFSEWLVQGTTTVLHPGDEFTPAADTVLVAQWKSLEYWTLTFDANGGSGTMDPVRVVKGSYTYLPSCGFSAPSHYIFNGWLIEGTKYAVGAKYTPVADVTVYATWRYTGGGGGGGSTPVQPVTPKVVDESTVEAEEQLIIVIPLIDEDGNIINLPVKELIMTGPVTGIVSVKDITEEINGITIIPSLKETLLNIAGFRVDTINEARALGIPVVDNYIGGNGHAPVLIESSSAVYDPVKFYQVFEITMNVTGGTLKEILFSVPLAALEEQGYTTKDVVLYHGVTENDQRTWYPLVTTHEWSDGIYAYYTAITDGASPFGIMFLKDTTKTFPAQESGEEPVTPVATPLPVSGILAGLGAGALLMRRLRK